MPRSEAQKRASKKWIDNNREIHRERAKKCMVIYREKNREELKIYDAKRMRVKRQLKKELAKMCHIFENCFAEN
jgi:hypothetical protein